jgi:hypothetical protein
MAGLVAAILAVILRAFTGEGATERAIERGVRAELGKVQQVSAHVDRGHRSIFSRTIPVIKVDLRGFNADRVSAQPIKMGARGPHGKIGRLMIHAEDFTAGGLQVQSMRITINSIKFSLLKALLRRKLALDSIGESTVSVTLTQESLTRYAAPKITSLRHPKLTLEAGRVIVEGKSTKLGLPVRFSALLVARDGTIELADPDLRVWIVPIPGSLVRRAVSDMNPLVDLNRNHQGPFHFRLTQIPVANGRLAARAVLIPRT